MEVKRILATFSFETDWERQTLTGLISYAREHDLHWEIRGLSRASNISNILSRFQPHGLLHHPHMKIPDQLPPDLKTVYFSWQAETHRPLLLLNDLHIGIMAAEYLLAKGFTRFCFTGNLERSYAKLRFDGFKHRLSKTGSRVYSFNTEGCFLGLLNNLQNPEIELRFIETLTRWEKPLALFAADDFEAYTILELCLKSGWNIPEQIGVLGVNNEEIICRACDPMLSSIRIPYHQLGYKAGELLHRLLQNRTVPQKPLIFDATEVISRRSTTAEQVADPLVATSLRYIRDHFKEAITTESLLELTGLSRSMLERRFKQSIKRTPYLEIQHQRTEYAKLLLRDTRMNIREIAKDCDFNSINRFCQSFKEKTGFTPSGYRTVSCTTREPPGIN